MTRAIAKAATMRAWHGQEEPLLADTREQIIDPRTAYQIVSMLEGVVQRGTGRFGRARSASRWRARPAPRRMPRSTWFIGFSPDLAAGVFVGFDNPRTLGPQGAGRHGGGADLPRFHEGRAGRCAAHAVPRRARHRGSADRLEERQCPCPPARRARSWKPSRPAPRRARPMRLRSPPSPPAMSASRAGQPGQTAAPTRGTAGDIGEGTGGLY